MKRMIKLLLLGCCLFLCLPASTGASGSLAGGVTEIPGQTSRTELSVSAKDPGCLAGGVVTEIPRQMFLTNLPASEFDAGSDPAQLDELTALLEGYTIIVTCGGETYELPMELSWDRDGIDFQTPGSYQLVGTILAPEGCTFGEGVLSRIVMPIVIRMRMTVPAKRLTSLHNAAPLLVGNMLCTGSYDSLRETEEFLKGFIQAMGAYNAYGDSAPLELDHFDDSRVALDTPGEYTIDAYLRLPAEFDGIYTLDPSISILQIPVRVSDPEEFNIWMSHASDTFFFVKFLPREAKTLRIFRTMSASPLTRTQLMEAAWTLCDTLSGSQTAFSVPRPLPVDTYVYFYLDDGESCSDYLCIMDDGRNGISYSIEGNRDGGDAIGPSLTVPITKPPVSSGDDPAPDEPSTEPSATDPAPPESKVQHPSGTEPVLSADSPEATGPVSGGSLSDMAADITGKVLLKMMEKGDGRARVSNDGITVTLRQEAFSSSVREDSEVKVTVSFVSDNQFVLKVTVDGNAVQDVAGTKLMVPYELQEAGAVPYLTGPDQEEIPSDAYDPGLHIASFTVGKCGTYTIMEKGAAGNSAGASGGNASGTSGGTSGRNASGTSSGASGGNASGTSDGASGGNASGSSDGASGGNVSGTSDGDSGGNASGSSDEASGGNASGSSNGASGELSSDISDGTSSVDPDGASDGTSEGAAEGTSVEDPDGLSSGEGASSEKSARALSLGKSFSTRIWKIISVGVILAALVIFFFKRKMRR